MGAELRLRRLAERSPELREAAETYRVLLEALRDAPDTGMPVTLSADEAKRMAARGEPLLGGAPLVIDPDAASVVATRLAEALDGRGAAGARPVLEALARRRLPPGLLLRRSAAGDSASVRRMARALGLDPGLLDVVGQHAVRPALRAWCRQLAPASTEPTWERGRCPVCGAPPALAELRGNAQARHLRCGRCGADWATRRLLCPFCGNEDPTSLAVLFAGAPGQGRIEVCDRCRRYVKAVAAFDAGTPDEVIVGDLETVPLDFAARAIGYRAPGDLCPRPYFRLSPA